MRPRGPELREYRNSVEGKPGRGLTSADRLREKRRCGLGPEALGRTLSLSQETVVPWGSGEAPAGGCQVLGLGRTWATGQAHTCMVIFIRQG